MRVEKERVVKECEQRRERRESRGVRVEKEGVRVEKECK